MSRRFVFLVLLMILVGLVRLELGLDWVGGEPKKWIVDDDGPGDFDTIGDAINACQQGDTVFVKSGVYCENIVIDKTIKLVGEKNNAVIKSVIDGVGSIVKTTSSVKKVLISGFTLKGGGAGIFLHGKKFNPVETVVKGNIITECDRGIFVYWSNGSLIEENVLKNNTEGIYAYWSSAYISRNMIQNNSYGFSLDGLNSSIIQENLIQGNDCGILIGQKYQSVSNRFFNNNFINNSCNVDVKGDYENIFDNGYPYGGNYWSAYDGKDMRGEGQNGRDGIGDVAYVIDENNQDNYPLMGKFSSFNKSLDGRIEVISDMHIENLHYFEFNNSIELNVRNVTTANECAFCRLMIPNEVLSPPYEIIINGNLVSCNTVYEDDSVIFLYCSSKSSGSETEFLVFVLLAIVFTVLIGLSVAIYLYQRKNLNK